MELIGSLDVDLTSLEQPLMRCKNVCGEFDALIKRYTPHSTDERLAEEISSGGGTWEKTTGFKNMLAGYKSTISIALAYANL